MVKCLKLCFCVMCSMFCFEMKFFCYNFVLFITVNLLFRLALLRFMYGLVWAGLKTGLDYLNRSTSLMFDHARLVNRPSYIIIKSETFESHDKVKVIRYNNS